MSNRRSFAFCFVIFVALLLVGACQKGAAQKDKQRTDDLSKQMEAQRNEAERLERLRAAESKMCVAQSATEFAACSDGIDNDCDRVTDCDDVDDCAAADECVNRQAGGDAIVDAQIGNGP